MATNDQWDGFNPSCPGHTSFDDCPTCNPIDAGAKVREAYNAFYSADYAWGAALSELYGNRAGDVRYTKEAMGDEGSYLRDLYNARMEANTAWLAAIDNARAIEGAA
jgi:hypothetical protein